MELADPLRSYAVLIGTSAYGADALDDLPAVAKNLSRLAELLQDPAVWGLPAGRCVQVAEPADPATVLRAIHHAARATQDTLLVYYAGHGLSDEGDLLLTLPDTDPEEPYTALEFDALRREVLRARGANRIVILDCCYSGRAMAGGMSGAAAPVEMAEQSRIAGSYLLTASAATRKALSPPEETYTAFTGELIRLLEHGLPGGDSVIEVSRIYEHLYAELRAKGRPLPQQRLSNTGRSLAFARNRHATAGPELAAVQDPVVVPADRPSAAVGEPALHVVPSELRSVLRGRPKDIIDHAAALRQEGKGALADELYGLVGALRPAQEVAALASLLIGSRGLGAGAVLGALTERTPETVTACLEAMHALDGTRESVNRLVMMAADRAPQQVAAIIRAFRAAGYTDEGDDLADEAVLSRKQSDRLVDLVGALWSADLEDVADRVIARATTDSAEEAARLADALLAMGRADQAFALYLRAADVVVRRPPAELARVLREMEAAGRSDAATELLARVTSGAVGPDAMAEVCEALWAAGLDAQAQALLIGAPASLGTQGVIELADRLRGFDRGEALDSLLGAAALAAPVEETAVYVDALRSMGRPLDANTLLARAAGRSLPEVAFFLGWLRSRGREGDRDGDRLLAAFARRPVVDRVAVFEDGAVPPRERGDLAEALLLGSEAEFLLAVRAAGDYDAPAVLVPMLSHLVNTDPAMAMGRLNALAREHLAAEEAVLAALMNEAGLLPGRPTDHEVHALVSEQPFAAGTRVHLMAALCAVGREEQVDKALRGSTTGLTIEEIIHWLAGLKRAGLDACADAVMEDTGRGSPGAIASLIAHLHERGQTEYAKRTLRTFSGLFSPGQSEFLSRALTTRPPGSTPFE